MPNEQDDGEGLCGGPSIKREREKGIRHESKKRRAKLKQNRIRSLKCRTPKKAQKKNEEAKIWRKAKRKRKKRNERKK